MAQTSSPLPAVCRPARKRDLGGIREFCRGIWDGHDYVPDVLEGWFHDPQGLLAVAEHEGRAIGCAKLTRLAEGQWWLEGFRVAPRHQGLKVGSLIHRYVDRWWLEHGDGALRLMTSSRNKSVHHLCDSTGFVRRFEVCGYKAGPLAETADAFTSAASTAEEVREVIQFALQSPSLAITNHIVDFGWRCADPTEARALASLVTQGSNAEAGLFWWRNRRGLLSVWDDSDPERGEYTLGLGILACGLEDMAALLRGARCLAATQARTSIFWLAPVHEWVENALKQAGYSSDWEHTALVFEKRHPRN